MDARRSPYHERLPAPALRGLVECYWFRRSPRSGAARSVRVLPDGCMDVIFDLGDAPDPAGRPVHFVVGTMRRALVVRSVGPEDVVGVRFRPGAAPGFVGPPADGLTDRIAPLQDLWADAGELRGRLLEVEAPAARTTVLDSALLARLDGATARRDADVLRACRLLAVGGVRTVAALVQGGGVGRRQLERRFRASVGLGPGEALRIARLRRATDLLVARPDWGLARVGLEAGYHDQPHFTRDFRTFAGVTPGAFRRERLVGGGPVDRGAGSG